MSSSFHRKPNSSDFLVPGLSTGDYSLTGIERDSTLRKMMVPTSTNGGGRIVRICFQGMIVPEEPPTR
jgi:hypothetical protein